MVLQVQITRNHEKRKTTRRVVWAKCLSSESRSRKRADNNIQHPRQHAIKIRHPKEGRFNSHRVLPPALRPAHYRSSGPQLNHAFGFTQLRGIVDVRHWGSTPLGGR
ncbi:hypothetical protein PILCRDRAFT_817876 [Piloderma croceum F 1598]|uniref:Uncharacterized protein n=1 Tax=Piloderma croceum (strain F 1598) TaxID=765440 RepID=A0A0C3G310_PILCF|nr:hypothetical protein PILCRDRAFT_817876 [Piloderma croceum F 1598]